ncbi:hypothetical protein L914_17077, partial [Phytophthora nicotianae]
YFLVWVVRAGFTSDVAIDKVYAAYGRQLPVTKVLIALRRDKRQGRSDLQLAKNWRGSVLLKAIAEKANRYMIYEKGTGCG